MSEQNRALAIRWFEEVWNKGSEAAIDELFHPEGHAYGFPDPDSDLIGPEAFKAVHRQFKSAFSGINVVIDDVIVEGDRVAIRWTSHMAHTGDTLGFPPTHKTVQFSGSSFMHLKNGKLHDAWNFFDFTAVIQQLRQA